MKTNFYCWLFGHKYKEIPYEGCDLDVCLGLSSYYVCERCGKYAQFGYTIKND